MPHTFANTFAIALERRFGVKVPVVTRDLGSACIVNGPVSSGGDPWSGHSTMGTVELLHFVRPDGVPMWLRLVWLVHSPSDQLDWRMVAKGFGGPDMEELRALLRPPGEPQSDDAFHVSVEVD